MTTAAPDPAEGAVLIRCDECDEDLPVWPDPAYPLVPEVEHRLDDTHRFLWPDRERKDLYREWGDHAV